MMKTKILMTFSIAAAISFAACTQSNQTPSNQSARLNNSAANQNSHAGMNHNAASAPTAHQGMDHGAMNHSEMKSSPNAAGAPYDLQFLDTMIAHHQGAVEMAQPAETKAERAELKTLAKNIVADQEREIAEMKRWRDQWFAGKPAALNMEMTGMSDSMRGMDMHKLGALTGKDFDSEFVKQMIPHHEGAVVMATEALQKSEKAEIKTLAAAIIKSQQAEIKQMKDWQTAWSKL